MTFFACKHAVEVNGNILIEIYFYYKFWSIKKCEKIRMVTLEKRHVVVSSVVLFVYERYGFVGARGSAIEVGGSHVHPDSRFLPGMGLRRRSDPGKWIVL